MIKLFFLSLIFCSLQTFPMLPSIFKAACKAPLSSQISSRNFTIHSTSKSEKASNDNGHQETFKNLNNQKRTWFDKETERRGKLFQRNPQAVKQFERYLLIHETLLYSFWVQDEQKRMHRELKELWWNDPKQAKIDCDENSYQTSLRLAQGYLDRNARLIQKMQEKLDELNALNTKK